MLTHMCAPKQATELESNHDLVQTVTYGPGKVWEGWTVVWFLKTPLRNPYLSPNLEIKNENRKPDIR